jgi:hypothetical protein
LLDVSLGFWEMFICSISSTDQGVTH